MDDRMLMARLGARSVRWDEVHGETPEFTSPDIAAALGMIEDDFSRELFCFLWWPEGATCSSSQIERMLLQRVMKECKARTTEAFLTRLTYTTAELELTGHRVPSKATVDILERYEALMAFANQRKWPAPRDTYRQLIRGVLLELAHPGPCNGCRGSGQEAVGGQRLPCRKCDGWGAMTHSDLARARRLKMTWHAYRKTWKAPYDWASEDCRSAAMSAGHALGRHLGCVPETPSRRAPLAVKAEAASRGRDRR